MKELRLKLNELDSLVAELKKGLKPKTILLLNGSVGAGKTHLVKQIVESFKAQVATSPTYSLINHYQVDELKNIYHIDLYRLKDDEDLESIGFWELFSEEGVLFIEWADKLALEDIPFDWNVISISIEKTDNRDERYYRFG